MMKKLILIALMAIITHTSKAQETAVPLTERGYISAEKSDYQIGDTLIVRGVILSTDYNDFYPYSRYVNVELIDRNDSIQAKQKVTIKEDGYFLTSTGFCS